MMSQGVGSNLGVVKTLEVMKILLKPQPRQNLNEHKQAERRRGGGGWRNTLHSSNTFLKNGVQCSMSKKM